jgi:anti-anti-sigma factor
MSIHPLEIEVRHSPGVAIVEVQGDIDGDAERALEAAYAKAEKQDPAAILLNLTEVSYINSKGIALIVVLLQKTIRSGRELIACGLSAHYQEIFSITRLADYISVYADERSALAHLRATGATSHASSRERRSD